MSDNAERPGLFRYGVLCSPEQLPMNYPATLKGDIYSVAERASAAGAEVIELHICDPLRYDAGKLVDAAKNNGLSFSAISTGLEFINNKLSLIDDDRETRKNAIVRLKEHIDLAEKIACPAVVIGVMRGNIPDFKNYDDYEQRLTEAVLELSDYAAGKPVGLLVEGINRYVTNYLCGVPDVFRYVKKLERPNIKVHIDTHQMNIEDIDFCEAIKECGEYLGYVHFSDNNRALPGGGNIDFLPIMKTLNEISYAGYIVIEGTECPPGSDDLRNCFKMLRGLESEIL